MLTRVDSAGDDRGKFLQEFGGCELNHCDRLLTGDTGKTVQEFFQRIAAFEIVKEIFEWHPRSGEAGRAAHSLSVDPHNPEQGMPTLN
jgi:hypothetical protein